MAQLPHKDDVLFSLARDIPENMSIDYPVEGKLVVPPTARGLVIFAHGSGSRRHSPRNKYVARMSRESSLATLTLLADLLSEEEDSHYESRFDIELLTERLVAITGWVTCNEKTEYLAVGCFGASTGAAAARFRKNLREAP